MNNKNKKNPWSTLKSKTIYDNPWIRVIENAVINPSGGEGIYGVVRFKNIAVGIVPLAENNNTWLVGQYRYTLEEYSWEIPEGGCLKDEETPLEAAKRELKEETGLEADKWIKILKMHTSNSVTDEVAYTFIAQGLTFGEAIPEETEELQVLKLPIEEAINMSLNNEIIDTVSIRSLLKTKFLLDNNKI